MNKNYYHRWKNSRTARIHLRSFDFFSCIHIYQHRNAVVEDFGSALSAVMFFVHSFISLACSSDSQTGCSTQRRPYFTSNGLRGTKQLNAIQQINGNNQFYECECECIATFLVLLLSFSFFFSSSLPFFYVAAVSGSFLWLFFFYPAHTILCMNINIFFLFCW